MKIAILTDHFPPMRGGFSRYCYEIVKHWNKYGMELTVGITSTDEVRDDRKLDLEGCVEVIPKRGTGYLEAFRILREFVNLSKRNGTDLFFFPLWNPYSLFMPILSMLSFKKYHFVIGCHGAEILGLRRHSSMPVKQVFKWLGLRALMDADMLFAISQHTAKLLKEMKIPKERITVFPNGVDLKRFYPSNVESKAIFSKYGIPQRKTLLTVAQLNVRKGIDTVVRVVDSLRFAGRIVNYIIVGSGKYESNLRNIVTEFDLEDQVFILTDVDDDELVELYNLADVFLLMSRQEGDMNIEGFGISIIEAGACGKPVIVANTGGMPDAVVDGKTGYILDPLNEREIKEKVIHLLDNPDLCQRMGSLSRYRIEEEFSWPIITAHMLSEFETLKR